MAAPKVRPSIVTKMAIENLVAGVICIIIGVWEIYALPVSRYLRIPPVTSDYICGTLLIVAGVHSLICGLGMLAGQSWSLKLSGSTMMRWSKRPEVRAYFGLPPAYPPYPPPTAAPPTPPPPTPPAAPACPACGQPLIFVSQYNRWYCQNCKKYP